MQEVWRPLQALRRRDEVTETTRGHDDMTEHTPGPWRIETDQLGLDIEGHVPISAPDHSALALVVWKMEDDERSPVCEANTQLIAAAPDMHAALTAALKRLQKLADRIAPVRDAEIDELIAQCRSALQLTTLDGGSR